MLQKIIKMAKAHTVLLQLKWKYNIKLVTLIKIIVINSNKYNNSIVYT